MCWEYTSLVTLDTGYCTCKVFIYFILPKRVGRTIVKPLNSVFNIAHTHTDAHSGVAIGNAVVSQDE